MADCIVLAGCAGIEKAAQQAGQNLIVPFIPGRCDASQGQTDVESLPSSNRKQIVSATPLKTQYTISAEEMLVDKAQLLTLTAPEMTVLVGGMRVFNANFGRVSKWSIH